MNPTPMVPRVLSTAIDIDQTTASLEVAMAVAQEFRLSQARAREIIREVTQAVKGWRAVAAQYGLSKRECERMASAFEEGV